MPRKLKKSFVGHPSQIYFWTISRGGVFQHPRLSTTMSCKVCASENQRQFATETAIHLPGLTTQARVNGLLRSGAGVCTETLVSVTSPLTDAARV